MSPEGPRPGEGGEFDGLPPEVDVGNFVRRHGVTAAEAKAIMMKPIDWLTRLAEDEDPASVIPEAETRLAELEERFGPADDWDIMRAGLAQGLISFNHEHVEYAMAVLAKVTDVTKAVHFMEDYVFEAARAGVFSPSEVMNILLAMQAAFEGAGRGEEFIRVHKAMSYRPDSDALDRIRAAHTARVRQQKPAPAPQVAPREVSYEEAQEHHPSAPWAELDVLMYQDDHWPEAMPVADRTRIIVDFGVQLHNTVGGTKIERKNAEGIKSLIAERQDGRSGEAWDRLRFLAAFGLYEHPEGAKFGRIITRSMDEPEMMAMIVHALLEGQRQRDAMDVMQDIPDAKVFGKMLALGEWPDRAAITALIEDVTVVTSRTIKKHDPQFRLGVAQGLHEHYTFRGAEGDEASAAHAETMRKRVELLQRQISVGYIKSVRKK